MQNKIFVRYGREMKRALARGDEELLMKLAARSASLIARTRHDLGQFHALAARGGFGRYQKAIARLGLLSTARERELALFTLVFFAGRQGDAAAMKAALAALAALFPGKVETPPSERPVPDAAWSAALAPSPGLGIDPGAVFAVAGSLGIAGPVLLGFVAGAPAIDDASWDNILAAAGKAGIDHISLQKAAVQLALAGRPRQALAAVKRIDLKYYRFDACKALAAALTASGLEMEAFEAFLEMGEDAATYQDEVAIPILDSLMAKGSWPEAFRVLLKLPDAVSRGDAAEMVVVRLAAQETANEDAWKMLVAVIDTLPIFNKNSLRAKLIRGLARHGMHEAALAEVNKLESDKLRQDGMMLLMGQMRESGAAPEKVREMLKDFNAPEGAWAQPAEPPPPSITGMLVAHLHETGFVGRLRQVSEMFGDFCGRTPAYKRMLNMGLEDEAFAEALEMDRADRKMTALAEIAQALHDKGRTEDAEAVLWHGLEKSRELEHQGEKARCLAQVALGVAKIGHEQAAQDIFSEAPALVQTIPEESHRIWPLERIVVCEARAGFVEKAREHLGLLLSIFAAPGIEEKEEKLSDLIGELVEAHAVDLASQALRHLLNAAVAEPEGRYIFKLFFRLRRIKNLPGWVLLAMISLSSEFDEKTAAAILWDARDLAIEKKLWDLAIAVAMKTAGLESDSSCFHFLQKDLLEADVPGEELERLLAAHGDVFSCHSQEGQGWLIHLALLLKAGRQEQAMELLGKMLALNMADQPSPCEKELREMEGLAASPAAAVPWALSFRPAASPVEPNVADEGEPANERWNRLFSSIIEERRVDKRSGALGVFFWSVPLEFAATFANILAYHLLTLRMPAIFSLLRRAIAEQNRAFIRLAIPLAYDCRDGVEMCRMALEVTPAIPGKLGYNKSDEQS